MSPLSLFPVFFFSFTIRLNPRIYKLIVLLVASSHLVCIHTYVCIHVCRNQRSTLGGVLPYDAPLFFLARGSLSLGT